MYHCFERWAWFLERVEQWSYHSFDCRRSHDLRLSIVCRYSTYSPRRPTNTRSRVPIPKTNSIEAIPTQVGDWQFVFASLAGNHRRRFYEGTILSNAARNENDQWIVPTEVELFTERGRRSVTLSKRDAIDVMGFVIPLPSRPGTKYEKWERMATSTTTRRISMADG